MALKKELNEKPHAFGQRSDRNGGKHRAVSMISLEQQGSRAVR